MRFAGPSLRRALHRHQALAARIEVETTAEFEGPLTVDGAEGLISFGAYYWKGFEPDGTRMNDINSDAIQNCMDSHGALLPDYIGKGEKAKGLVLLDVTSKSGEVAFDPIGDGGWVWKYPETRASAQLEKALSGLRAVGNLKTMGSREIRTSSQRKCSKPTRPIPSTLMFGKG